MESVEQVLPSFQDRLLKLAKFQGECEQLGLPVSSIEAAEKRLGFALPEPLKVMYLTIGGHEAAMTAFNPFLYPEEICNYTDAEQDLHPDLNEQQLIALGGDLVIAYENQGCWTLRYNQKTGVAYFDLMLNEPEDGDDEDENADGDSIPPHINQCNDLEQVLIWNVAQQCFNSDSGDLAAGEFDVSADQLEDFFAKVKTYFVAYTSDLDKTYGNVYFNEKEGVLLTGSVSPQNGRFFGYFAYLDTEFEQESEDDDSLPNFVKTLGINISYF